MEQVLIMGAAILAFASITAFSVAIQEFINLRRNTKKEKIK